MAMKVLNIIATAYRATLEEQGDPIVWLTHAMRGAGADIDVLLRGNAVNYAVRGQDASGLAFGGRRQTQPPRIDDDVAKLITKGVQVFLVEEDLAERGVERADLIAAVEPVTRGDLPKLLAAYDQVWQW
jgi:sulfur transfer complex TusBCD TusB component (DsrH family)